MIRVSDSGAANAGPLKILRVITRLNIGGPSVHAAILSTKLDPVRFSTTLVVGTPAPGEGDLSELVDGRGVRVIRLGALHRSLHPVRDLAALVGLIKILWKERPDIIHTHMAKAGTLGRLAGTVYNGVGPGRDAKKRAILIHTFHGHVLEGYFHPWAAAIFARIERALARRTDILIAISPAIRQELLKRGIGHEEQIQIIPLGLDLSVLADLPARNGSVPLQCGLIGRLVPVKNPTLFLEALERVVKQVSAPRVRGIVIGDGPLRMALEAQTRTRGMDQLIRFTGWQRDLPACYRELDIVCVTSWNEGTPVALIEAMAAGRPVVATDVGGVRDLVGGGEAPAFIPDGCFHVAERGLLIRAGDSAGLAAALEELARNAALRDQLGRAAKTHVLRHHTQERLVQDITILYDGLVQRREQMTRLAIQ